MRPKFCILNCKPIVSYGYEETNLSAGGSCFCLGLNNKIEYWIAEHTEHINDLNVCFYTPFKGWTRFVMNNSDLEILDWMIFKFSRETGRHLRLWPDRVSEEVFTQGGGI